MLNFDPSDGNEPILTSPRSIDACLRQGIKPRDLLKIKKEKIKEKFSKEIPLDEKNLKQFETHFEERRKKKLEMLLEVREEIIEEEKLGLWKPGILSFVLFWKFLII